MPSGKSVLEQVIEYRYVLLVFLLFLTFWSSSQALFTGAEWTSAVANTLHFILIVAAALCIIAADIRQRQRKEPKLRESARKFLLTFALGASWFFIFIAISSPALDVLTMVFMTIYFWKGAAVEELLFRYALPRLMIFEGYGSRLALLFSNLMFSFAHFFVWEFNLIAALIGVFFGFAQSLAFWYGQSFQGIIWGHTLYNLALIGCNAWFMVAITILIVVILVVLDVRK